MRRLLSVLPVICFAAACGDNEVVFEPLMVIDTPSFTLQPGEEKFYCYFTSLPATEAVGIRRAASSMPEGSHHMIVFKTRERVAPDNTFGECDDFGGMMEGGGLDVPV